jgi:hypothetical protein
MNRIGLCATVVAMLSAISFPVGAWMLNSAASGDAGSASVREAAAISAPVLSPEGKPVRVISLSTSDQSGEAPAISAPTETSRLAVSDTAQASVMKPLAALETQTSPVIRRVPPVHVVSKRKAAAPALGSSRSASVPARKAFMISGLF